KFAPVPCASTRTGTVQAAAAPTTTVQPASASADPSIVGYWTDLFHEDLWDRRSGLLVGDFTGVPLNAAGKLASASWDPGWFAIPEEQCRPHTGIYGMRGPTSLQITQIVDETTY